MNYESNDLQKNVEKMTGSHLNNIMQLAVFYTANYEIYAINVAKIQNFVILDEINIVPNRDSKSVIKGVAQVRDELVTFVDLDSWLGMPKYDPSVFTAGVVCNLNCRRIGFFVRDIIGILDKYSFELKIPDSRELKILYVTSVKIGDQEKPCAVFDVERLMIDCGFPTEMPPFTPPKEFSAFISKKVLIAEDSGSAARKLTDFFDSLGITHELYPDGAALISRLDSIDIDEVGLVVTDIEMPVRDGFQVIAHIKRSEKLNRLPVVVNSSMTSGGVVEKVKRLGAVDLVNKSDPRALFELVKHYMGNMENADV
ncbi:MAG: chemotaxis protein CheW [Helicobacteraceae bacterium]|jgi:two-component system chemotaxis response regulator CheV|nr:chemotaxis protein CheW [Helicobacteraceae bacterium]